MAFHSAQASARGPVASPQRSARASIQVSSVIHAQGLTNRIQRIARRRARALAPLGDDTAYQFGILFELLRPFRDRGHFLDDLFDQRRLAFQAADTRAAATRLHPGLRVGCLECKAPLIEKIVEEVS